MEKKTIANIIEVYKNSKYNEIVSQNAISFVKAYVNDPETTNEDIKEFLKIINGID